MKTLGETGEQLAAKSLREQGYQVYSGLISVHTSYSKDIRYPDLAFIRPGETTWELAEVKTNTSPLIKSQIGHDRAIESQGGTMINGPLIGRIGPTPVVLIRVILE